MLTPEALSELRNAATQCKHPLFNTHDGGASGSWINGRAHPDLVLMLLAEIERLRPSASPPVEGARRAPSDEMRGVLHAMGVRDPLPQDVTLGDLLRASGVLAGYGVSQLARAPGRMFPRSDIVAVLCAQRGVAGVVVDVEYERLISIFQQMEQS